MKLDLETDRRFVRVTGGSRRHLVIRWTAPSMVATERRPPVRVAFSLDRSGSMGGQKIATAREALLGAMALLDERDAFSVVAFDDRVEQVIQLSPATPENKAGARAAVGLVEARGNTNLFRGFLTACETIATEAPGTARCMLLTDGQANQEETNPEKLSAHARALRERGIGLSTFGIGADFDEVLLRAMADSGGGNFFYVETAQQIPEVMRRELSEVLLIAQKGVGVRLTLPAGVTARLVGEHRLLPEPGFGVSLGDLVGDEMIELVVSLKFPAGGAGMEAPVGVGVFDSTGDRASQTISWSFAEGLVNDTQPRNVVADRLVAQRHADRARLKALRLNREGRYRDAATALTDVAAHIRGYAGTDAVLLALIAELHADAVVYAQRMDEQSHKTRHMTTSSRIRSKLETGSARRSTAIEPEES